MKKYKDNVKRYLDKEVYNYLVSDILNGNSKYYSDLEIESIVKTFCLSRTCDYYNNFNVAVLDTNNLNDVSLVKDINGLTKENNIFLNRENLLELKKGNIDILRTIMHEVEHVRQIYMIEHNDISYRTYLILMDEIVSYKIGNNYYKDNYEYIFSEIDARIKAEFDLYDFLSIYCPNLLASELDNIAENILQCEKDSLVSYRIIDGVKYDLEELFDTIIKNNPSIVKHCPVLNFYYYQDGSKIPLGELIRRKNIVSNNDMDLKIIENVKKLDNYIIRSRKGSKDNLNKDIESIIELNDESNREILSKLYNRINNYNVNDVSLIYDLFQINNFKIKIEAGKNTAKVYNLFNR